MMKLTLSAAVNGAFYLFVLSLAVHIPRGLALELPTVTGTLVLALAVLQPRRCFGRLPWALIWLAAFLVACVVALALRGSPASSEAVGYLLVLLQALLLMWVGYNLMQDEQVLRLTLVMLVLGGLVLVSLGILGIGMRPSETDEGPARVVVLGQNPNVTARLLAASLVALLGLSYGHGFWTWTVRLPIIVLFALAIVETGSRGGLLAAAAGCAVFSVAGGTGSTRLRSLGLAVLTCASLGWAVYQSELMTRRATHTVDTGRLAGREHIFPAAWEMFMDRPLTGWGVVANKYELVQRLSVDASRRDTHNLWLEVLTAAGLLGAIPFMVGLWLCLRAAWKARRSPLGATGLALLATIVVGNMSRNDLAARLVWLVFAYTLAVGATSKRSARAARPSGRPAAQLSNQYSYRHVSPERA